MNKIICDICGTSYPETAQQCPICGCTSGEGVRVVEAEEEATPKTYVKGGHFSKSNVRKRNKAAAAAPVSVPEEQPQKEDSNKGLLIAVLALVLCIIAVLIFIYVRFLMPQKPDHTDKNETTTSQSTEDTGGPAEVIPCEGLTLETSLVELAAAGEAQKLSVTPAPANTTDVLEYVSSDPTIASVAEDGTVTAVGPGQAVITVTCGGYQAKCRVVCNFDVQEETIPDITEDTEPSETTEPSEVTDPTEPSETTEPKEETTFKLNRSDITMKVGESWNLYNGEIAKNKIKWTSDNEAVAKIENGKVTAVGAGTTKVHGEYNGVKSTCIIRVKEAATEPTEETTAATEDTSTTYSFYVDGKPATYVNEATIKVGGSFKLTLVGDQGNAISVSWTSENTSIASVSGTTVKGLKAGNVDIYCVYKDQMYVFTVRVKAN